jgi:TolB-like protein/DNA-binding winged helix-turn-helix (wHTH) protein/Tfp pilus assembly protein PilF
MSGRFRTPIRIGDWIADPKTDTISRRGETQKLEPRMMRLLLLLAETPGDVVSVEQMLNEVWHGVIVGPASVYQAVSQLRRLLGDSDSDPTYVATVPRKGYRLIAEVSPLTPPAPPPPAAAPAPVSETPIAAAVLPRRRIGLSIILIILIVALVLVAVVLISRRYFSPPEDTSASIVVLPFVDMTEEHNDQIFCDGLTEELSNWLAQIPTLRVVARTSAFLFRGQHDAREIGKTLNATHVLEGSIRRSGDHVRITVQLIDARTGYLVWESPFDPEVKDTIEMQESIARSVAENLQIPLTASTTQKFAERHGANPQAYKLYLFASRYRLERTRESTIRAIELYQQALSADPDFALAYVGLAYAYLNQRWVDVRTTEEVSARAEPLLDVAQRLDPNLSELYAVRGALRAEQWRFEEAQRDLQRAVETNPNDSWAFAELGRLYLETGRPRDSLSSYAQALRLDPLDFLHFARECVALADMARYTQANAACTRARTLQDQGNFAFITSSWLERTQGQVLEALSWNAQAIKVAPNDVNLYDQRGDLMLSIGLSQPARQNFQQALAAGLDRDETNLGLAEVAFYEGGPEALQAFLSASHLDDASTAVHLMKVAYLHVLAGDFASAHRAITRAMAAPDFVEARLNDPWFARWGQSDLLVVALCELQAGEKEAGDRHLGQISAMIGQELAAGVERFGVYELQAQVLALRGDADAAMRALTRAADLGWRRAWWAEREPYFAALRTRNDFRNLLARVNASNQQLRDQANLSN